MDTQLDLSGPVSSLLKAATADAHDRAEKSSGAGWLARGELDKEEYVRYLVMLYYIYDVLERALDQHSALPSLQPTYNPTLLARTPSILADISHLLQVPEDQWKSHPIHLSLAATPPTPLTNYVERIRSLADSNEPVRLLAHAYVRYLGDLSGGQFIKRQLAKAYQLEDGAGLRFYDFRQLGGSMLGTIGDMKKVKEWYRDGMDAGVGQDVMLKQAMLDEASIAFDLNTSLLDGLRPPSRSVRDSTPVTTPLQVDSLLVKVLPGFTVASTYHVGAILGVVAAVFLSHIFLTLSGYTPQNSIINLEAVQHWFAHWFPSLG